MRKSKSITLVYTTRGYSWLGETPTCSCIYSKKLGKEIGLFKLQDLFRKDFKKNPDTSPLFNSIMMIDSGNGRPQDVENIKIIAKKLKMKVRVKESG